MANAEGGKVEYLEAFIVTALFYIIVLDDGLVLPSHLQ